MHIQILRYIMIKTDQNDLNDIHKYTQTHTFPLIG